MLHLGQLLEHVLTLCPVGPPCYGSARSDDTEVRVERECRSGAESVGQCFEIVYASMDPHSRRAVDAWVAGVPSGEAGELHLYCRPDDADSNGLVRAYRIAIN